jgi:D-serine deaminase-like pyridoxal phosphate-dependent protein
MHVDGTDDIAVGDLIGCGISHPCTAFDKWRLIPVVDDGYRVVDAVMTFF